MFRILSLIAAALLLSTLAAGPSGAQSSNPGVQKPSKRGAVTPRASTSLKCRGRVITIGTGTSTGECFSGGTRNSIACRLPNGDTVASATCRNGCGNTLGAGFCNITR